MLEQMGPQRFWHELREEAPRYAKLIPELPRLVHQFLQQKNTSDQQVVQELLREQRRTNRLLQGWSMVGWVLYSACWRCKSLLT